MPPTSAKFEISLREHHHLVPRLGPCVWRRGHRHKAQEMQGLSEKRNSPEVGQMGSWATFLEAHVTQDFPEAGHEFLI